MDAHGQTQEDGMQELKAKWEEWYGDMVQMYQWHEIDHKGKDVLYVHGACVLDLDEGSYSSYFIQILGYVNSGELVAENEREELVDILKSMHGIDNISFWMVAP